MLVLQLRCHKAPQSNIGHVPMVFAHFDDVKNMMLVSLPRRIKKPHNM